MSDEELTFEATSPETGEVYEFEGRQIILPGKPTRTSLTLPPELTYEQWRNIGSTLQGVSHSLMWWIGDWYRYGEDHFSEDASQAVEENGYLPETVRNAVWVANRIDPLARLTDLSWSHHQEAARLDEPRERSDVLKAARREKWTKRDLRAEVNRRKGLPDPAPRPRSDTPEPPPEPLDGSMRDQALKLSYWLIEGRRMVATFKSGQVAALRCRENGVTLDADRIDAVMEFLSVLYHTLTAEEPAEEAA